VGVKDELIKIKNPYPGKYFFKVIPKANKFNDSICYQVAVLMYGAMGPKESEIPTEAQDHFWIYPNPATDHFKIRLVSGKAAVASLEIADLAGKSILKEKILLWEGENEWKVSSSMFAKGLYVVSVTSEVGVVTQKLVIE
jgi:hypothetical protein